MEDIQVKKDLVKAQSCVYWGEDSELLKVWTITKDRIQRKVLLSSCRGFQGLTGFWLLGYLS